VFPAILAYRLFRGVFPKSHDKPQTSYIMLPKWANAFAYSLIVLESWLMKGVNLPVGCSLIALAQKRTT